MLLTNTLEAAMVVSSIAPMEGMVVCREDDAVLLCGPVVTASDTMAKGPVVGTVSALSFPFDCWPYSCKDADEEVAGAEQPGRNGGPSDAAMWRASWGLHGRSNDSCCAGGRGVPVVTAS
jgi:hypothetical protein